MKYLALIIIVLVLISGCLKYQDKCKFGECVIQKSCSVNTDCIVSCGCECVAKNSICPGDTAKGNCPIGGLECGCLNNTCIYDTPQKF